MIGLFQNMSQDYVVIIFIVIAVLLYKIVSRICDLIEVLLGHHDKNNKDINIEIGGEEDDTSSKSPKD